MSSVKHFSAIKNEDIFIGYVSQFLNFGVGLLLLPFSIACLSGEEASLWLIIMTIVSSVSLLDFGFSQTITRNFSYVLAGVPQLKREAVSKNNGGGAVNYALFYNLLFVTKRIYQALGIICIVILGTLGTKYILILINKSTLSYDSSLFAWGIYVISITLNVVFLYFVPALLGCGKVRDSYLVNIISRCSMLVLSIIALVSELGLIGLATSYLLSIIISSIYRSWIFYRQEYFQDKEYIKLGGFDKSLFNVLWHNASKLGLVMVGSFFINRFTGLLAGWVLPLEVAGSYALTMQVFTVLMSVSQTYFQAHIPMFSRLQVSEKNAGLRKKKYIESVLLALFFMIFGSGSVVLIGDMILKLIDAKVSLLSSQLLLLASFICLLEVNHSIAATFITTKNSVPFVKASLLSALSVVILSTLFSYALNLGVIGLLIGQGLSQICYNNWRWPLLAWKMVR
ncbi:MAG: hypothetical protein OXC44_03120 [Proteobacteria bacterium]|nr:hypothetical protein [Pseudomonadota bacterium]